MQALEGFIDLSLQIGFQSGVAQSGALKGAGGNHIGKEARDGLFNAPVGKCFQIAQALYHACRQGMGNLDLQVSLRIGDTAWQDD